MVSERRRNSTLEHAVRGFGEACLKGNYLPAFYVDNPMSRLVSHRAVRGVVLLLLTLSAVGFTTVVQYCTMSRSPECCCTSEQENHPAKPVPGTSLGDLDISCDVRIVAGGLTPVALNTMSDATAQLLAADLAALESESVDPLHTFTSHHPFMHSDDTAPPPVDIYIRTCSLLI